MQNVGMLRPGKKAGERERQARKSALLQTAWRTGKRHAPAAGAFFLFSLAQSLALPSPYAVCCLSALLAADLPAQGAAVGLGVGILFRLLWGLQPDFWLFFACAACLMSTRFPKRASTKSVYARTAALLLLRALPDMIAAEDVKTALLAAVGMLLGLAVMPALLRSARLIAQPPQEWTQDDLLCLMMPGVLLIAGAARLHLFHVNVGYAAAAFGVLLLSWTAGGSFGVCAAMGGGLALLLSGQSALLLVNLAFGALTAGLFQGKNRLLPLGVFLLSVLLMTYLIAYSFQRDIFLAALAGGLFFAFMPGKRVRAAAAWMRAAKWSQPRENAYTKLKMQRWVRAIDRLADALPRPQREEVSPAEESESLKEALCAGCDQMTVCWHEAAERTQAGFRALAGRGGDPEEYLSLINRHFSFCPRISRLPELLNRLDAERRRRERRTVCAEYEREMLQTHLTALSQAAQRISLEEEANAGEENYWIAQADEALQAIRFPGKTAFVKRNEGHFTVGLQCEMTAVRPLASLNLARQVGTYLRADMEVTERRGDRIILEEKPPLRAVTGFATACAVTLERKKQPGEAPDNGDAVLIQPLSGGKEVLALSDGMGHGAGAQEESRKTLDMLSMCLEAGYSRSQAMTAVNGAMLAAAGGEKFATVDLCLINLWTGEAALNKLGACASVLLQGQKSQWIRGEALPLGIIERVRPMEHCFTLGEGDLLILMSDGIADVFSGEEEMTDLIRLHQGAAPQQLADALLHEAVMRCDGLPPDDMTVLCARIADRKAIDSD